MGKVNKEGEERERKKGEWGIERERERKKKKTQKKPQKKKNKQKKKKTICFDTCWQKEKTTEDTTSKRLQQQPTSV